MTPARVGSLSGTYYPRRRIGLARRSGPPAATSFACSPLHRARIAAGDVAVASDHGRELLDYVLGGLCD
jgi:hypothetical protein